MREIKFRGYDRFNQRWVYGYGLHQSIFIDGSSNAYVTAGIREVFIVDKESAGQYTGIKDYEGKEIYEGDIVEKEIMESIFDNSKLIGVVKIIEGCWCVVNDKKKVAKNLWSETDVNRVIGNVYENKNLLEVK
jgi:uncharacterized phage protein (TIGR01671 family)|nr:MAG TPA: YopX protein [Caudoviricetes sp.]